MFKSNLNRGYVYSLFLLSRYGLQKGREWNLAGVLTPDWSATIDYFKMPLNKDNENRPWLNYHWSGSYGRLLSNNNIIKANLHINFSNTAFMEGEYTFEVPGQTPSTGIYKVKGSYIGIAVSYVFTKTNKTLERMQRELLISRLIIGTTKTTKNIKVFRKSLDSFGWHAWLRN